MLAIISHSKNFDSQTDLQMVFENGAKAIASYLRGLLDSNCQSNTNVAAEVYKVPIKRTSGLTVIVCKPLQQDSHFVLTLLL